MKKLGLYDILETKRCILKIPQESDAKYMWSLISDNTTKYMVWNNGSDFSQTLKNVIETREKAQKGKEWQAGVYLKDSGKLIGRCGINTYLDRIPSFQLGYCLSEEYYGRGIIPECVNRFVQYGFEESHFKKVIIRCDSENVNSEKVALKCGFIQEGELKKHENIKGKLRDTKFFAILKEKYLGNQQQQKKMIQE